MLLRALGPVQVEVDGVDVPLPGRRCRAVLGALLLHAGRVVPVDLLVDLTWHEDAPRTAAKTLQTYVGQLREALGADRVVTEPGGYRLRVEPGEVDVTRFEEGVAAGQAALASGEPSRAAEHLEEALRLWRGRPFGEVSSADAAVSRLEERRLVATVALARARLDLGQADRVVPELEALLVGHPLREDAWYVLMLALHRCGRTADAVTAYDRARRVLSEELGVLPGAELARLHQQLLEGDTSLSRGLPTGVRYADSGGRLCAFQQLGTGEPDLLVIPDWFNNVSLLWQQPEPAAFLREIGGLGRTVLFDAVGMGMSDPPAGWSVTLEGWLADALSVLDAARVRRPVVLASSAGAAVAVMLAARHPERVSALVLHNPLARVSDTALAAIGYDDVVRLFAEKWATGVAIPSVAPSRVNDAAFNAWFGRFMGASASARTVPHLLRELVFSVDVLAEAERVTCPVLITHRRGNRIIPSTALAPLAEAVPRAQVVGLEGEDHVWFLDDRQDLLQAVRAFLAEQAAVPT